MTDMSFSPHPQPPSPPAAAQATGKRRLRKGYIACLVSLATTLVVFAVLLVLGVDARQPAPDFLAEPDRELDVELELGEEHVGELGLYSQLYEGGCAFTTPSGEPGLSTSQSVTPFDYGDEKWQLIRTMEIPEAGIYRFVCDNENADFGIASTHVADTARNRQLAWGLTWLGLPAIGLITTATIAAVTFRRDRREKAAAPVPG